MSRWFALCLIVLCAAGCRAPRPTFDPFAPFGSPCVPPPATGTVGYGQGYYQPPVAPVYGPSARALQSVPTLGSAAAQLRTSQAPQQDSWESATRPDSNAGAIYQPRTVAPLLGEQGPTAARDEGLVWIPPYDNRSTRVASAAVMTPAPAPPPANLPPTLNSAMASDSYGLIPPANARPTAYLAPVRPSLVRPLPNQVQQPYTDAYVRSPSMVPMGSTVTYETPYIPPGATIEYGSPLVASVPRAEYRGDGWQPRSRR